MVLEDIGITQRALPRIKSRSCARAPDSQARALVLHCRDDDVPLDGCAISWRELRRGIDRVLRGGSERCLVERSHAYSLGSIADPSMEKVDPRTSHEGGGVAVILERAGKSCVD